jgi:hypothetical protein
MPRITNKTIESALTGYKVLKNKEDDDATYFEYSEGQYRMVAFMMKKRCWYHGEYACYEYGSYLCSFGEDFLKKLNSDKNPEGSDTSKAE